MMTEQQQQTYEQATALLLSIWRDVDADYKSRYAREIWRMFEDAVRVSANQNGTLVKFASALCKRMQASLGRNDKAREASMRVIQEGNERAILRVCREETPYVVMLVRAEMLNIKERFEEEYS